MGILNRKIMEQKYKAYIYFKNLLFIKEKTFIISFNLFFKSSIFQK